MNSFHLAARRTQALASRRFFSKGSSIPTSSTAQVDGVKIVGLPHMSVRYVGIFRKKFFIGPCLFMPCYPLPNSHKHISSCSCIALFSD